MRQRGFNKMWYVVLFLLVVVFVFVLVKDVKIQPVHVEQPLEINIK